MPYFKHGNVDEWLIDGKNLDTTAYGRTLYHPSKPHEGLYSYINGNIDKSIFDNPVASATGYFVIRPELVRPNLMAKAYSTASLLPVEYFSDAQHAGGSPLQPEKRPELYGTVAGTSIKFFLPYRSVCLIDISTYMSVWRNFYVNDTKPEPDDPKRNRVHSYDARLRLIVNGIREQERGLPFSAQASAANRDGILLAERGDSKDSIGDVRMHEVTQGFHHSMHAQKTLGAGWHEAHIDYRLECGGVSMGATIKRGSKFIDTDVRMYDRVFFGIRNARVLSFYTTEEYVEDLEYKDVNDYGKDELLNWYDIVGI